MTPDDVTHSWSFQRWSFIEQTVSLQLIIFHVHSLQLYWGHLYFFVFLPFLAERRPNPAAEPGTRLLTKCSSWWFYPEEPPAPTDQRRWNVKQTNTWPHFKNLLFSLPPLPPLPSCPTNKLPHRKTLTKYINCSICLTFNINNFYTKLTENWKLSKVHICGVLK